jgi:hypothetical protein
MSSEHRPVTVSAQRLQNLIDEYKEALAAGEPISVDDLLRRHSEMEPDVARALSAMVQNQETLAALSDTPTPEQPQGAS